MQIVEGTGWPRKVWREGTGHVSRVGLLWLQAGRTDGQIEGKEEGREGGWEGRGKALGAAPDAVGGEGGNVGAGAGQRRYPNVSVADALVDDATCDHSYDHKFLLFLWPLATSSFFRSC